MSHTNNANEYSILNSTTPLAVEQILHVYCVSETALERQLELIRHLLLGQDYGRHILPLAYRIIQLSVSERLTLVKTLGRDREVQEEAAKIQ
ncbi:unnamed protein product [Orchesella dallaii]|uniref:Uncharacterized protein n=1 Tax=Orchesella dallaii TaxID=48710 RepID=A0ABP1S706_9HEXA